MFYPCEYSLVRNIELLPLFIIPPLAYMKQGATGDWDLRMSDLVKNPE